VACRARRGKCALKSTPLMGPAQLYNGLAQNFLAALICHLRHELQMI
jgi:hypothetical protein